MPETHQLSVHEIKKTYEGQPLLNGVSFDVASGEVLCLLGRSGSGKSTLLRIIAGIENADSGLVCWDGKDLRGISTHLRRFGLMFQDYALFPHRNVAENVAFGLRMQGASRSEIEGRVSSVLEQVHMDKFALRSVTDLSGGEQQRVALARALAAAPRLLMLDEPLAALDRSLREQLQQELRDVLHRTGIPAIYVTHDQEEALALGDRMALLNQGEIVQNDIPEVLYRWPKNRWVAQFLGMQNFIEGRVTTIAPLHVQTAIGSFQASAAVENNFSIGEAVILVITPGTDLTSAGTTAINPLTGICKECLFKGEYYQVQLQLSNGESFLYYSNRAVKRHENVALWLPVQNVVCLKK
jgi:ABC-type Fe3+/spermidine/putrescine transport system ATPase subunit